MAISRNKKESYKENLNKIQNGLAILWQLDISIEEEDITDQEHSLNQPKISIYFNGFSNYSDYLKLLEHQSLSISEKIKEILDNCQDKYSGLAFLSELQYSIQLILKRFTYDADYYEELLSRTKNPNTKHSIKNGYITWSPHFTIEPLGYPEELLPEIRNVVLFIAKRQWEALNELQYTTRFLIETVNLVGVSYKPPKTKKRKPNMEPTFFCSLKYNDHKDPSKLRDFFDSLRNARLIHEATNWEHFRAVFTGNEIEQKIYWIGFLSDLHYLLILICHKYKVINFGTQNYWVLACNCFCDENGNDFDPKKLSDQKNGKINADKIEKAAKLLI